MPEAVRRRCRRGALLAAAILSILLAASALAAAGGLTQKTGAAGCISDTGTAGACVDGTALDLPGSVTVSPDGTSVYVAAVGSDAVAIFDRDTTTGALTQKPGAAGCISETGSGGACVDGTALDAAETVTVSPDGASVYVASREGDAVAIFDRNTTTGALTQKPGSDGCISETGSGGACVDGTALDFANSVTVSPDGTSVYVASLFSDAVAIFDRDTTTGALTQKPGAAGCISETGSGGACADGGALDGPESVSASPDGKSVYLASPGSDALAIFDRNTTTGALTQKPGAAGCISDTGTAGACVDGTALEGAFSVTVSPDGTSAYVASPNSDAVASFDRSPATGALTQVACISKSGTGGFCAEGTALDSAASVTVSPDGTSAYVASSASSAVVVFDRALTTGGLTQKPGVAGCIAEAGTGTPCAAGTALNGALSVTVSPDGTSAYAAAFTSSAVAIFDREPDTTPPGVMLTKKPKKKLKTKKKKVKVKVSFTSEAGATFTCKLDKGSFEPCSSPFKAKLKSGRGKGKRHTIQIVATDTAANASAPAVVSTRVIRRSPKK